LIELKLGVKIDISRKGESTGRKAIKSQIRQILRKKGIDIEELVMNTGKLKLEKAFPNICVVLKKIEENV